MRSSGHEVGDGRTRDSSALAVSWQEHSTWTVALIAIALATVCGCDRTPADQATGYELSTGDRADADIELAGDEVGGRTSFDLGGRNFSTGHERMVAILKTFKDAARKDHMYYGRGQQEVARERLASLGNDAKPVERFRALGDAGLLELMFDETPRQAIKHLTEADKMLPEIKFPNPGVKDQWFTHVKFLLAVAWLRVGETENCCLRHTAESCIVPIRGGGIHTDKEGSRNAIRYFTEMLDEGLDSADTNLLLRRYEPARWLLNIAHMTLDEYPEKVPDKYLISPERFKSDVAFPRFENVAPKLGLDTFNHAGSAVVDDFDNDDYLDIFTSSSGPTSPTKFFHNNGDGTFTDRSDEAGLTGLFGGLNIVSADYNNDGNLDVYIMRGAWRGEHGRMPNSLLRNNGDSTFTDVTFESGLGNIHFPAKTAAWADYDNDGDVDLFVANEADREPKSGRQRLQRLRAPSQLFRNNGDGTFTDVAKEAGVQTETFGMGTCWGDYDQDGWEDLFVSGFRAGKPTFHLFRNQGNGTFVDMAATVGIDRPAFPFATWFWDFNNDGALDLYVCSSTGGVGVLSLNSITQGTLEQGKGFVDLMIDYEAGQMHWGYEVAAIYQGDGHGGFKEVGTQLLPKYPVQPMGANFGDVDGDGYLDFYLGTGDFQYWELRPNLMFRNRDGKGFENVSMSGGFGHLQKGHGVCFADIDNDGDQDVYMQMGGQLAGDMYSDSLYQNPGFGYHWITIKLVGHQSNRSAIGARIRVDVVEGKERRSIYRHVNSGGSFGCNPLRQNIGLRNAERIESIEIHWPKTGQSQTFKDVHLDQQVEIHEGRDNYRVIKNPTFTLGQPQPDE